MRTYNELEEESVEKKINPISFQKKFTSLITISLIVALVIIVIIIVFGGINKSGAASEEKGFVEKSYEKDSACTSVGENIDILASGGGTVLIASLTATMNNTNRNKNNQEEQQQQIQKAEEEEEKMISPTIIVESVSVLLGIAKKLELENYFFGSKPETSVCNSQYPHVPLAFCDMLDHKVSSHVAQEGFCRDSEAKRKYNDLQTNPRMRMIKNLMNSHSVCDMAVRTSLCLSAFPVCTGDDRSVCSITCNIINMCAREAGYSDAILHCANYCLKTWEAENPCYYYYWTKCSSEHPGCDENPGYIPSDEWTRSSTIDKIPQSYDSPLERTRCLVPWREHYKCCLKPPTAEDFAALVNVQE